MPTHERIGAALNSRNLRADALHSDIDVVAALAFASRLGASLQALRSAGHNNVLDESIRLLSGTLVRAGRRKKIGISPGKAATVARQALLEWMIRICVTCGGSGMRLKSYSVLVEAPGPRQSEECPHCDGSGLFVPTWKWRAQTMGLGPGESPDWWSKRIDLGKLIADDAFSAARRSVSRQLTELPV
jgi:hypothetical protein